MTHTFRLAKEAPVALRFTVYTYIVNYKCTIAEPYGTSLLFPACERELAAVATPSFRVAHLSYLLVGENLLQLSHQAAVHSIFIGGDRKSVV